jgi:hypothetical protein
MASQHGRHGTDAVHDKELGLGLGAPPIAAPCRSGGKCHLGSRGHEAHAKMFEGLARSDVVVESGRDLSPDDVTCDQVALRDARTHRVT